MFQLVVMRFHDLAGLGVGRRSRPARAGSSPSARGVRPGERDARGVLVGDVQQPLRIHGGT